MGQTIRIRGVCAALVYEGLEQRNIKKARDHACWARPGLSNTSIYLLILHEKQLHRILNAYVNYFIRARPYQGIRQQIPELLAGSVQADHPGGEIISFPVLSGLHHDYRRNA